MSKSSTQFLNYQEERYYAEDGAQELGFIHRNTSAHYKGQDVLLDIQSSRSKLAMLKGEIASIHLTEDDAELAQSEAYLKLLMRAENEKAILCSSLDAYATGLEKMAEAARQEQAKQLQSPIVPETHKNLVHAA